MIISKEISFKCNSGSKHCVENTINCVTQMCKDTIFTLDELSVTGWNLCRAWNLCKLPFTYILFDASLMHTLRTHLFQPAHIFSNFSVILRSSI